MHFIHRYVTIDIYGRRLWQECRVCGKQRAFDLPSSMLHSGNHNTRPQGVIGSPPSPNARRVVTRSTVVDQKADAA